MRGQSTSLYAAYGSNLHPQRLRERIRSATLRGTGFLREYTLRFHKRGQDNSAKCGFSDCGEGLHVAVYEMNAADRTVLDGIGMSLSMPRAAVRFAHWLDRGAMGGHRKVGPPGAGVPR